MRLATCTLPKVGELLITDLLHEARHRFGHGMNCTTLSTAKQTCGIGKTAEISRQNQRLVFRSIYLLDRDPAQRLNVQQFLRHFVCNSLHLAPDSRSSSHTHMYPASSAYDQALSTQNPAQKHTHPMKMQAEKITLLCTLIPRPGKLDRVRQFSLSYPSSTLRQESQLKQVLIDLARKAHANENGNLKYVVWEQQAGDSLEGNGSITLYEE